MKKDISIYIHIPFCISKCDYCDFFSVKVNNSIKGNYIPDSYITSLINELSARFDENYVIKTIYIGGGTPSLLNENQIKKLVDALFLYEVSQDYEFTFEVNPDDITKEYLQVLAENKINRISCGIQSFSNDSLNCVHRRADLVQVENALDLISHNWYKKTSVDLICGLPGETEASMLEGLKKLCKKNIPHISFYSLCVEDETPLGKAINTNKIVYDFDKTDELWIKGRAFLLKNGYEQYEISNFAKPGYECIHNMTYWEHKDYLGIGAGGTGSVYKENGEGYRWTNSTNIDEYIEYWTNKNNSEKIPQTEEIVDLETSIFEYFMMGLRLKKGIYEKDFYNIFSKKYPQKIIDKLEQWKINDYCSLEKENSFLKCKLSEKGMLFLNTLLEDLI